MKEQGWRKVTYGTFPRPGRTVYAHCGMECSSNFRQCPKTEESDIKLAAAVNLSGVDFCLLKTAAQFGINQQRKKCHVKTACLKMLKLRQQKKKFIHTTTMVLHLSCSVIPLSSCVLHGSEVHAVILSMHTNASSVVIEGLVFSPLVNPFVWASVSIAAAAGSGANRPGRASDEWEVSACLQSTHRSMACRGNAHYPRTDTTHSMYRGALAKTAI